MTRRSDTLDQIQRDLRGASAGFSDAERRMMDARAALPGAASYEGASARGLSVGSSVERLALTPDPTDHDRRLMDTLLHRLARDAHALANLVAAWTPRPPSERDKAEVSHRNDTTCEHCTRWRKPGNAAPIRATGDVSGNLADPLALCDWCYRFVRRTGRTPSKGEVERNDDGLRVMVAAN